MAERLIELKEANGKAEEMEKLEPQEFMVESVKEEARAEGDKMVERVREEMRWENVERDYTSDRIKKVVVALWPSGHAMLRVLLLGAPRAASGFGRRSCGRCAAVWHRIGRGWRLARATVRRLALDRRRLAVNTPVAGGRAPGGRCTGDGYHRHTTPRWPPAWAPWERWQPSRSQDRGRGAGGRGLERGRRVKGTDLHVWRCRRG